MESDSNNIPTITSSGFVNQSRCYLKLHSQLLCVPITQWTFCYTLVNQVAWKIHHANSWFCDGWNFAMWIASLPGYIPREDQFLQLGGSTINSCWLKGFLTMLIHPWVVMMGYLDMTRVAPPPARLVGHSTGWLYQACFSGYHLKSTAKKTFVVAIILKPAYSTSGAFANL